MFSNFLNYDLNPSLPFVFFIFLLPPTSNALLILSDRPTDRVARHDQACCRWTTAFSVGRDRVFCPCVFVCLSVCLSPSRLDVYSCTNTSPTRPTHPQCGFHITCSTNESFDGWNTDTAFCVFSWITSYISYRLFSDSRQRFCLHLSFDLITYLQPGCHHFVTFYQLLRCICVCLSLIGLVKCYLIHKWVGACVCVFVCLSMQSTIIPALHLFF